MNPNDKYTEFADNRRAFFSSMFGRSQILEDTDPAIIAGKWLVLFMNDPVGASSFVLEIQAENIPAMPPPVFHGIVNGLLMSSGRLSKSTLSAKPEVGASVAIVWLLAHRPCPEVKGKDLALLSSAALSFVEGNIVNSIGAEVVVTFFREMKKIRRDLRTKYANQVTSEVAHKLVSVWATMGVIPEKLSEIKL